MLTIAHATPADAAPILALQRFAYEAEARLYDEGQGNLLVAHATANHLVVRPGGGKA